MTRSSPSDLAVAFRSIERRLREAQSDGPEPEAAGDLQRTVAAAARLVRAVPTASAVAAAIEDTPADAWDIATLDELRGYALEIGRIMRGIADEDDDD